MPAINRGYRQRSPDPESGATNPPRPRVPPCGQLSGGRSLTSANATAAGAYPLRTPWGERSQGDVCGYAPASLFGQRRAPNWPRRSSR